MSEHSDIAALDPGFVVSTCLCEHGRLDVDGLSHQSPDVGVGSLDLVHAQCDESAVELQGNIVSVEDN